MWRLGAGRVWKNDIALRIEPRAFRVLVYLLSNRDRVISKQELLDAVWDGTHVTDNAVARIIAQLRTALGDDARKAR